MPSFSVGRWVRQRREDKNLSREDVIRMTGLGISTIKRVETDDGDSNRGTMLLLGVALDVKPPDLLADWAAGMINEEQFMRRFRGPQVEAALESAELVVADRGLDPSVKRTPALPSVEFMTAEPGKGTPVLGEVTAGGMVESLVFDNGDEPERVPLYYPGRHRTYALRIRGDSMSPEYRAGEILIVQDGTIEELEDGEDAVVQTNGAADGVSTFKRCVFVGNLLVRLLPLNEAYKPIDVPVDHIARIGKVLGVYRPRRFGGSR